MQPGRASTRNWRTVLPVIPLFVLSAYYPLDLLFLWNNSLATLDPSYYNRPEAIASYDPNFWDYRVIQFYEEHRDIIRNFTTLSIGGGVIAYYTQTPFIDLSRPSGVLHAKVALVSNSSQEIFGWLNRTNTRLFLIPTTDGGWRYDLFKGYEPSVLFQLIDQKNAFVSGRCYVFEQLAIVRPYQIIMLQEVIC